MNLFIKNLSFTSYHNQVDFIETDMSENMEDYNPFASDSEPSTIEVEYNTDVYTEEVVVRNETKSFDNM